MKALVTSKGQVTLPKERRDQTGIEPGAVVGSAGEEEIRLQKMMDRRKQSQGPGCLKAELAGQSVSNLLDDLRGPVELPNGRRDKSLQVSGSLVSGNLDCPQSHGQHPTR